MDHARRPRFLLSAAVALFGSVLALPAMALQDTPNEGAWLGVYIQDLNSELRQHFPTLTEGGVLVTKVLKDSPADRAGLLTGDVLAEIDGTKLESAEHLRQVVSRRRPDTDVPLVVLRKDQTLNLTAHLSGKPASVEPKVRERSGSLGREVPWDRWFVLDVDGGLGARMSDMNEGLAEYFPAAGDGGVLVLEVCGDSSAEKAGLHAGDVIVSANDNKVQDLGDLRHELRRTEQDTARLELLRHGARIPVTIELRTGPECWRQPGRSFYRLRPDAQRWRPEWRGNDEDRPDADTEDDDDTSGFDRQDIDKMVEDEVRGSLQQLERNLRAATPDAGQSDEIQAEMRGLREHTEQLESSLDGLRRELAELRRSVDTERAQATPPSAPSEAPAAPNAPTSQPEAEQPQPDVEFNPDH